MTARRSERVFALIAALDRRRIIHLSEAAELLGVSEMTIRRDVAGNPEQFAFLGGHIMAASHAERDVPYELSTAADSHAAAKREACAHAAGKIRPGETIFVDCGTTLVHLVELIPDAYQVTAICYAMNVAQLLTKKPGITTIVLGGVYHPASASFSGTRDFDILDSVGINVAFLSAAGADAKRGATCEHFPRVGGEAEGHQPLARELSCRRQQQDRQDQKGLFRRPRSLRRHHNRARRDQARE